MKTVLALVLAGIAHPVAAGETPACDILREVAIAAADMRQSGLSRRQTAAFASRFGAARLEDPHAVRMLSPRELQEAGSLVERMIPSILDEAWSASMQRSAPAKRAAALEAGSRAEAMCLARMPACIGHCPGS